MRKRKPIEPGTAWITLKLHVDAVEPTAESGKFQSLGKERPSIILRKYESTGTLPQYLTIYLTHSGLGHSGSIRDDVIPCGPVLDQTDSYGEIPPVKLSENMFTKELKAIDRQDFQAIKKKVEVCLMRLD